jgi:aspartate 1-decarboxylase
VKEDLEEDVEEKEEIPVVNVRNSRRFERGALPGK